MSVVVFAADCTLEARAGDKRRVPQDELDYTTKIICLHLSPSHNIYNYVE